MKKKLTVFMTILLVLLLTVFSACASSKAAQEESIINITLSFDWPQPIEKLITEEEFNAATRGISEDPWTVDFTWHRYPC